MPRCEPTLTPRCGMRPRQDYLDTTNYELMEKVTAGQVPHSRPFRLSDHPASKLL